MFISECGDRTQFTSLSMAAIYNFYGVVIGTSSALIITIFLGVFLGKYLIKYLKEKTLNAILGVIQENKAEKANLSLLTKKLDEPYDNFINELKLRGKVKYFDF